MGDWFSAVNWLTNARGPFSIQKSVRFHSHWNITLQLPIVPNFNMQASFTYTPLKPTASVCKGRKRVVVSRQSLLAQKNAQTLAGLEPIDLILRCCNHNCFKQFDNVDNMRQLRETFFQFTKATLKKRFLKDLLLCRVPDPWTTLTNNSALVSSQYATCTFISCLVCPTIY